jgi:diguanylate cyclase (GGDEF)-like protein/PAS domain S-box-containing protein
METLAAVRSYVGGESLWAKAQKRAAIELVQYARSGDETRWEAHRDALTVVEGFRRAREALEADPPDVEAAREGFLQGGVHPHDVDGMIRLFRVFPRVEDGRAALDIWTRGDVIIEELRGEARTLRRAVDSPEVGREPVAASLARIDSLDAELTRHEEAFSRTLAGAAHTFRVWVYRGIGGLSLALLLLGGSAARYTFLRLRRREEALRRSEEKFRRIFLDSQDAIYVSRPDGTIVEMNPAGIDLLGYPEEELSEMDAAELYADPADRDRFHHQIGEEGQVEEFEVELRTKEGDILECVLTSTARFRDGEIIGYQGIIRDVTERKEFERQLEHRALHDPLTELPNRALFWDRIEQSLARIRRRGGQAAILFMDLDRFKDVNDSLGHTAGDRVLQEVADRLRSAVRDPDTVARLGGDEFGILLEEIEELVDAREVARRVSELFDRPLRILEQDVHLSASIGIGLIPDEADEDLPPRPGELVRRADAAMYRAKSEPGTRQRTYDPSLDTGGPSRVQRESDLRRGLEAGEFVLHYQPVFAASSGEVVGVEPLLRWNHPERGLLGPEHFLALADETGLLRPLGGWVLEEACRQVARWNADRGTGRELRVHPNASAVELVSTEYLQRLEDALDAGGMAPRGVMLEVTEHTAMKSAERIDAIRELGVRVAVDDFGTGYSSLAYVKELRVDALKVDRSFVSGLPEERADRAIVETILTLARSLEMEVVAEGVETEEQADWLRSHGCEQLQGFLLARPAPPEEIGATHLA